MKAVHGDDDMALANFYRRIRNRFGAKIACMTAARILTEICWKRLRPRQRKHAVQAA